MDNELSYLEKRLFNAIVDGMTYGELINGIHRTGNKIRFDEFLYKLSFLGLIEIVSAKIDEDNLIFKKVPNLEIPVEDIIANEFY